MEDFKCDLECEIFILFLKALLWLLFIANIAFIIRSLFIIVMTMLGHYDMPLWDAIKCALFMPVPIAMAVFMFHLLTKEDL